MKNFLKEWLPYILIIIIIILLRTYIITPVIVKGTSMEPALKANEVLFLSKINYKLNEIERFDIVVVDNGNDLIIKRIIGLPGENVEYKDNKLHINDEIIEDNYAKNYTDDFNLEEICNLSKDNCTTKIPKDKYLVLGDNREVSSDSRNYGLFDINDIKGKIVLRIWPLTKIKLIKK